MTKQSYRKLRQALRVHGCNDYDIIRYWTLDKETSDRIYYNEESEVDHLYIRSLRLGSGGKLIRLKRLCEDSYFLTVR